MVGDVEFLLARQVQKFGERVRRRPSLRLSVDQVLLFVLELHIGAAGVYVQANSGALEFIRLVEEALRQRDSGSHRVSVGNRSQHKQVLTHNGRNNGFPLRLLVGARSANSLLANLIAADLREAQDSL